MAMALGLVRGPSGRLAAARSHGECTCLRVVVCMLLHMHACCSNLFLVVRSEGIDS